MDSSATLEQVHRSKVLHLPGLDMGYNRLPAVPATIASLTNLEQLWLQGNPIASVHPDIQQCVRLKVLDLRDTELRKLPRELCRLPTVLEIDLRGCPLKPKMKGFQRNTKGLMEYLKERDARKTIKEELYNKLSTGLYREVLDSPLGLYIAPLIKAVCLAFNDLRELAQVARHCDRLFPADLASAVNAQETASRVRAKFVVLGRKIERKRLASELELKMRAIYYDVIEPAAVQDYIASIYRQVEPLEDIQFIVRHAGTIMPPDPVNITGEGIQQNMMALQKEKTEARRRCVDGVFEALTQIYSDQESSKVLRLTQKVAAVFANGKRFADGNELEELKQLKADVQRVFPAEIREAEPVRIRMVFEAQRREQREAGKA